MLWSDVSPQSITWSDPQTEAYLITEDGKQLITEDGKLIVVSLGVVSSNANWSDVSVT